MKKRRPTTATDDVRNFGGKEVVLNRMINHYKSISNAKPSIQITPPFILDKQNLNINNKDKEFNNVRETYKGVSNIKHVIDTNKPQTFKILKSSNNRQNEMYEDTEHIRRLNAMSKRILSIGKPHERKKNIHDPLSYPTYFFRKPNEKESVKLIDLETFHKKLQDMNKQDKNKLLLHEAIYSTLNDKNKKEIPTIRPKSSQSSKISSKVAKYTYVNNDPDLLIKKHMEERYKNVTSPNKRLKTEISNITFDLKKIPRLNVRDEDSLNNFKFKIMQYVLSNRIYKDEDIEILRANLIKINCIIFTEEEINEILNLVIIDLDS